MTAGNKPGAERTEAKRTKQARAFELAGARYELRQTAKGQAYARREGINYFLDGPAREALRADIREVWPGPDDPPSDSVLNSVIGDLRHAAKKRDRDEATAAEEAAEMAAGMELDEHPERLKVGASGRNPFDVAREVADYILKVNNPPHLFAMGPAAAVLLRDDGTLEALDQDGWLAYIAERVDFLAPAREGGQRIVSPPLAALRIVGAITLRELPQLDGVTSTPYLDAGGSLIATDGYHQGTRLVLRMGNLVLPPVSDAPTTAEVRSAVNLLTGQWLVDFPFASSADRANLIAELLTITGRELFPLPPLFVHDASTSGSGKGLLLHTISIIATGNPAEVMELPGDGDEQRKTVTSVLLAGKLLVAWDELHIIQGRTMAAILTAEVYSGRILGANKLATVRNKLVQIALGNNVEVRGDMKRRVVPARLTPEDEHPEHRTDFRHPDLEGWVREHRGDLLAAAFTIWRHWMAAGCPEADVTLGSFERWARVVGGALQAAGIPGFLTGTRDWLSFSEDDDGWPSHLGSLRRHFGEKWFTVSQVADAVIAGLIKRPPLKRDPDKELASQIGYAYRGKREKWHGDLRLVRSQERDSEQGGHTWSVRKRGAPREGTDTQGVNVTDVPDSSSVSSACPEPQVRAGLATGDRVEVAGHVHGGTGYLQEVPSSETAGQTPVTEDTEHTGDKNGRPRRNAHSARGALSWRSDGAPAIGDGLPGGAP